MSLISLIMMDKILVIMTVLFLIIVLISLIDYLISDSVLHRQRFSNFELEVLSDFQASLVIIVEEVLKETKQELHSFSILITQSRES